MLRHGAFVSPTPPAGPIWGVRARPAGLRTGPGADPPEVGGATPQECL